MDYPFESILLDNREISIASIREGTAFASNEFGERTIAFIRDWLSDRNEFELYTSGSTGTPKRILLTRFQMESSARMTAAALNLRRLSNALVCLDTRFIAGQMMLVRCLTTGMFIHAVTPSANPLQNSGWGMPIHFVAFVPYQLQAILSSPLRSRLNEIENVIVGGAPLAGSTEEAMADITSDIFMTYGMTETVSHIALRRLTGRERSNRYHTLPGITISADDRSCLIIDCPYVGAKVITNDIVNVINQTTFEWVGRFDNVINSGGVKLHPESLERQLEAVLRGLNLHGRFIISAVPDDRLGQKAVIVLEKEGLEPAALRQILDAAEAGLPKFQSPKEVRLVSRFPETPSGKVDRGEIMRSLSKRQ